MKTHRIPALVAGLLLFSAAPCAQVTSQVSPSTINADENLQLVLESDGDGGWPDLSPLEQDFYIVNRSSSRSVRTFNGQTRQKTSVRLLLRPKKSGTLLIPALLFGNASSQSHQVTVLGTVSQNETGPDSPQSFSPAPGGFMPPAGQDAGVAPWFGAPGGWGAPGFSMPAWALPADADGTSTLPAMPDPAAPATPGASGPATGETDAGYWPWLTATAVLGWLLTSIWLWHGRHRPPMAAVDVVSEPPSPPEPLPAERAAALMEAVESAYRDNDAFGAKQALLHWGAFAWPQDPPTNLSRLAARCPPEAQRQILKLEEAQYSPHPIVWNDKPLWEMLHRPDPAQSA